MMTRTQCKLTDSQVDLFLFLSLIVLGSNLVSQIVALPLQILLLVYALTRFDVRFIPAVLVLQIDKSFFPVFEALPVKFNIGIPVGTSYVVLMVSFTAAWAAAIMGKFDSKTRALFVPWCIAILFAIVISVSAHDKVTFWQNPISLVLSLGYYFFGLLVARSWENGKEYLFKRLLLILVPINILWTLAIIRYDSFSVQVMMVCSTLVCLRVAPFRAWFWYAFPGCVSALYYIFFGASEDLVLVSAEGTITISTFSTVFVGIFGVILSWWLLFAKRSRPLVKYIPHTSLLIGVGIVTFAVAHYRATLGKDVESTNLTLQERFEYKLIADRGEIWSKGVEDICTSPFLIKRLEDRVEVGPDGELNMKCEPHNQFLTFVAVYGWGFGVVLSFFLLYFFITSFKIASRLNHDPLIGGLLLPSMGSIYMVIGLTGQSILASAFYGNAIATLVFPGIIYGVYLERARTALLALQVESSFFDREGCALSRW